MRLNTCSTALALSILIVGTLAAQTNNERGEFGITVGELSGGNPNASTPTVPGALTLDSGVAFEANYAGKVRDLSFGSVYWEVDGLAGPMRYLSGFPATATHELRSVYVTPGVKLQFMAKEALSPWVAAGAGYAFYDTSGSSIATGITGGGTTSTAGTTNTYAVDFGGGVDYSIGKRYVIRGEVRGFYTGSPNFGVPTPGGQFNLIIGGGIVWRFSK